MTLLRHLGSGLAALAALSGATPVAARAQQACAGQPNCAEARGFTATITNFRPSVVDVRTRAIAITMRFENRSDKPLILGYVAESGIITDDQGQRYLVSGPSVRGIGLISNTFDPKFVLRPGEASDARFELVTQITGANPILGTKYEMDIAIREIDPLPANQFRLGREHSLHFAALAPSAMAAGGGAESPAPATPAEPAAGTEPEPEVDHCAGKSRCYDAGPFTAEMTRLTPSQAGRHHVVTMTLRIRNVSKQPLILGYKNASNSGVDNYGNRYYYGRAGTHDGSAQGIGLVAGRVANPQFALQPGQSRDATMSVVRFNAAAPIGQSWTYDVALVELEPLPGNQIRVGREYALNFVDVNAGGGGAARKLLDALRKPKQ